MALTLYYHPLASFCWKVLIALYENDTPFSGQIVDLMDEASAAAFREVWPIGKFPVLQDDARGETVPESSTIIEYLDQHYAGPTRLVPADRDRARQARLHDRIYDLYVHQPMQKIVTDRLRPSGKHDPHGVEETRMLLRTSLAMIDKEMRSRRWAAGEAFTLADCA
ncbi:MAG TPA: glutathione S-transferase family protein, partial [Hyphomicrobiaceae bacterium]|nr:glutathione S-transferase family protein [Hyphomicrobiaceae bacterium]